MERREINDKLEDIRNILCKWDNQQITMIIDNIQGEKENELVSIWNAVWASRASTY